MIAGLFTAALLVLFIGGWIWAWSPRRKAGFDAAARLPLDDETTSASDMKNSHLEQTP